MLYLTIPKTELWNEATDQFEYTEPVDLELEHSLVSLSKWESFYEKPFLNNASLTTEETRYYIKCMCLTPNVDDSVFSLLSIENIQAVDEYIKKKHTATWFNETSSKTSADSNVITSEIIYYWMVSLAIPFETERWNINRLLTLIKVTNIKNQPPEKLSREEAIERVRRVNARKRAELQANSE